MDVIFAIRVANLVFILDRYVKVNGAAVQSFHLPIHKRHDAMIQDKRLPA